MTTQISFTVWLLFFIFTFLHAFPVNDWEVPIKNEKLRSTEKTSDRSSAGLETIEEKANVEPAQVDDNTPESIFHKKFGECEDIAKKKLRASWSTKKKCLSMLYAEMKTRQNSFKKLKSSKTVTKDAITAWLRLQHQILDLIERVYLSIRNAILGAIIPGHFGSAASATISTSSNQHMPQPAPPGK